MTDETIEIGDIALHQTSWLSTITEQLLDWDYSEVSGSGRLRKHDKFALVQISINKNNHIENEGYLSKSVLVWRVDPQTFPQSFKEMGLPRLQQVATFFLHHVEAIKGERIPLRIEITRAGFNPSDDWVKVCSGAMLRAIISCFDEHEHDVNEQYANEWFARHEGNRSRHWFVDDQES